MKITEQYIINVRTLRKHSVWAHLRRLQNAKGVLGGRNQVVMRTSSNGFVLNGGRSFSVASQNRRKKDKVIANSDDSMSMQIK